MQKYIQTSKLVKEKLGVKFFQCLNQGDHDEELYNIK